MKVRSDHRSDAVTTAHTSWTVSAGMGVTCDQTSRYFRGGKVRQIQLLDYLSVASPESGLFSDWSRNKRYLELSH